MTPMLRNFRKFLFENQSVRQTIAKNTFWLTSGELLGRLLRTGIVIYAARLLGPSEWGVFSYIVSLSAVLTILSDIGLGAVLIREGARRIDGRAQYFSTIFLAKLFLTVLSFFVLVLVAPHIAAVPLTRLLVLFIAILFVFDSLRAFATSMFRALEKMEREAMVNIVTQGIILFAGIIVFTKFVSKEALALTYAVGAGGGVMLAIYFLRSHIKELFTNFNAKLLKPVFQASGSFALAGVLGVIMVNIDTLMIGWFLHEGDVGFYAAAQKPITFLYAIPSLIAGGFFPVLARFAEKEKERFRMVLQKGLKVAYGIAFPAAFGLFLTAGDVVGLLYGDAYAPGASSLQILSLTLLTTFPMSLIINGIFAYNRQRELIFFGVAGVLTDIVLNTLFIPLWGIAGAASSTLLTQLVYGGLVWRKMQEIVPFSVFGSLKKIVFASLVVSACTYILQLTGISFLVSLPFLVLLYLLVLYVLKEELFLHARAILET